MSSHSSLSLSNQRSPSPKRPPHGSPIKRKPLHPRTASQTNEHPATIRLVHDPEAVDEPDSAIYAQNPFPKKPSQVFHPSLSRKRVPQDRDRHVSDAAPPENPPASSLRIDSLLPAPLHPKTSIRGSTSTITSDIKSRPDKDSSFSPSSSRLPSATFSAPLSEELDVSGQEENEGDDAAAIPADIRPILPTLISQLDRELSSRASETSLASSITSDTLSAPLQPQPNSSGPVNADACASSTSLVIPERNSNRPLTARSRGSQRSITTPLAYPRPILKRSADSIASRTLLSQASIERLRAFSNPSAPWHAALQATLNSGVRVQYPTVKPPPTAGSWASIEADTPPPITVPKRRSLRMNERSAGPSQWGTRPLSTIPSESERASVPFTEGSGVTTQGSSPIERRRTRGSLGSSFMLNATPEELGDLSRNLGKQPARRDHDEDHDTVGELSAPYMRMQRSGSHARFSDPLIRPESSLSDKQSKRSSYGSYVAATLPDWAKRYYSLGERTSLIITGLPNSSTTSLSSNRLNTADTNRSGSPDATNIPFNIFHPRKRPRIQPPTTPPPDDLSTDADPSTAGGATPSKSAKSPAHGTRADPLRSHPHRDSLAITPADAPVPPPHERLSVLRPLGPRRISVPFSPHLRHDRRSTATALTGRSGAGVDGGGGGRVSTYRLSAWRAPSLEEVGAGCGWVWSPEGRQVVLFTAGFLVPFAWWLGAVLPLPRLSGSREGGRQRQSESQMEQVGGRGWEEGGPRTRSQLDVEAAIVDEVGSLEERKYEKARWWRGANRVMSVVGVVVVAVIIALVVIAVHMR
ncbi:MAG: hypothetical protein M1821_003194 [Bathelium mastoideum]|nr:MAG: hypothetical protein M1821_003194 [Bathelium mastoideum]